MYLLYFRVVYPFYIYIVADSEGAAWKTNRFFLSVFCMHRGELEWRRH